MSARTLLISDLHLESSRPEITDALLRFLASNKSQCDALFILGDLFEVWIGDDEHSELTDTVATALRDFARAGSSVYIMHGNRDFLIGEAYARSCDAELIQEPYILQTPSAEILLLHGDTLCTDDVEYQKFRQMVRQESWQQEFLSRSLDERRAFASQARQQSQEATADKAMDIMDVSNEAVQKALVSQQANFMIHGHTHRPAIHEIQLDSQIHGSGKAQRVVLGDWDQMAWFAEINDKGIDLQQFPVQP